MALAWGASRGVPVGGIAGRSSVGLLDSHPVRLPAIPQQHFVSDAAGKGKHAADTVETQRKAETAQRCCTLRRPMKGTILEQESPPFLAVLLCLGAHEQSTVQRSHSPTQLTSGAWVTVGAASEEASALITTPLTAIAATEPR